MCCRIAELKDKQVISIKDDTILGYVCDVEVDTANGKIVSLVLPGKAKFFGLFGHEDDIIVPWCEIEVIGRETILVCTEPKIKIKPKRKFFPF